MRQQSETHDKKGYNLDYMEVLERAVVAARLRSAPIAGLWLVKTVYCNELHRSFIVRATSGTEAIEYVKEHLADTYVIERVMLSFEPLEASGEPGVVMAQEW